jgi:hypothetical protein
MPSIVKNFSKFVTFKGKGAPVRWSGVHVDCNLQLFSFRNVFGTVAQE